MNASSKAAAPNSQELFRLLPSVNEVLIGPACEPLLAAHPRERVLGAVRAELAAIREEIAEGRHSPETVRDFIATVADRIAAQLSRSRRYSLRPLINASGVILHTNVGRAPLSENALQHIAEVAADYCNLELDLETGERSRRDLHAESLLLKVLGVDAASHGAVIVNNCAAATFLALNSLAEKQEVIVSRGELVEIGGGFRIPEILEKSGATLKEVGTTNRTRLSDYESALTPAASLILRVHRSNFSIEGFTERPGLEELVSLAERANIHLFEDQGTGLLTSLQPYGVPAEPTLPGSLARSVHLVAASGDKLLGGPQCGLLIGRNDLIQTIQKNPLLRAFRVDKLTYAALEATLYDFLLESREALPLYRMLAVRPEELSERCRQIATQVHAPGLLLDVVPVDSLVGGGAAPKATLPSCALALRHASMTAEQLASSLRSLERPILGRISDNAVYLDLRTVPARLDTVIASALNQL